jgi:hypothetical protein
LVGYISIGLRQNSQSWLLSPRDPWPTSFVVLS